MMKRLIYSKLMIFLFVFFAKTAIIGERTNPYVTIDRKTVWSELEIPQFFYTWNRTKTLDGTFFLESFLLNPIKDKKILLDRQNFIKKLINERETFEKLQKALEEIAQVEQAIFEYFKRDDQGNPTSDYVRMFNAILSSTAGIKRIANRNSLTQEWWFAYRVFSSFWPLVGAIGGQQLFSEIIDKIFDPNHVFDWKIFTGGAIGGDAFKKILPRFNMKKSGDSLTVTQVREAWFKGYWFDVFNHIRPTTPLYNQDSSKLQYAVDSVMYPVGTLLSFSFSFVPTFFQTIGLVYSTDVSRNNIKMLFSVIAMMQHHFCMIRKYVELVETIVEIQSESDLLSKILPSLSEVFSNENFQEIVSLLKTETFKEPSKYFFYHGRAMQLQKLIDKHFKLFGPLATYIAELDAYMAMAQIIRECENAGQKFSFVEYIESEDGAIIDAKGAWHPLLFGTSVKQDVQLGVRGNTQHMVITGPNWSGKSIYLKTVGIIAYLAQTITAVPADSCTLTLFDNIKTSLDPKGDISKELSKFKKQQDDLDHCKTIIATSDNNKSLLLVDEILSGTVDDMIAARSIEFGTSIIPKKHAIVLVTTHVLEPTELERLTNGLFKNFHIEIIPQNDGTFVRTFRIVRGPATWWFDPMKKMLRIQFIDWVNSKNKTPIITGAAPTQ